MDILSVSERSLRMALVRSKNTKPGMLVRRVTHGMDFRYRLHDRSLPGKPDLVFRKRRKIIFVHGCFWHRHQNCKLSRLPKSRQDFWLPKLERNRTRDIENFHRLDDGGWDVLVIWECETSNLDVLKKRIKDFLR